MAQDLFNWVLNIPQVLAQFGNWLVSPIYAPYLTLSPLGLFGIAGVGTIIVIIGVHVVRLFV